MSSLKYTFLVAIFAILAAQQLLALTESEEATLNKVTSNYLILRDLESSNIFAMLRKCTIQPDAKIEDCFTDALLKSEKKKHKHRLSFVTYWASKIELPCYRIRVLVTANWDLLSDETKSSSFQPKLVELLDDYKICSRIRDDTYLAAKVHGMMLKNY